MKEETLHLFLIGTGLIGGALLKQIAQQLPLLKQKHNLDIQINAIANSKNMFFAGHGIPADQAHETLTSAPDRMEFSQYLEQMTTMEHPNSVLVDCTASEEIAQHYLEVLNKNISIVTPNKKAASGKQHYYSQLKQSVKEKKVHYLYETNVGAGLPVISTLNDLILSGDRVEKIEAILSGTLSYIFNTFDGSEAFSEVVKAAKEKGYTEPDPRDDLNGMDVARKILILAREAGHEMEIEDVEIVNLISSECEQANTIDDFFVELAKMDTDFEAKVKSAQANNQALRFIATLENGQASIELKAVDQNHPFYSLSGADNIVSFTTKRYHDRPLVIKGPGAGAEVTAAGVFADIIRIASYLK